MLIGLKNLLLGKWRWVIFACLIFSVVVPRFSKAQNKVHKYFVESEQASWDAANAWLASVKCFHETGVWLAFFKEDIFKPFKNKNLTLDDSELLDFPLGSPADDPGHALCLTLKAKLQDRLMLPVDIGLVNVYINTLGLLSLLAITSKYLFFHDYGLSPHPSFNGVAALALIFPIVIIGYYKRILGKNSIWIFGLLGFFSLTIAKLLRGSIGSMGLVVTLFMLIVVLWKERTEMKKVACVLILGCFALLAAGSTHWIFMIRDNFSPAKISKFVSQELTLEKGHGISHTLYVGLGAVSNPWGIKWDDGSGYEAVKRFNPDIVYASPQYFQAIRTLYMNILKEYPLTVAKIYWQKLLQIFRLPFMAQIVILGILGFFLLWIFQRNSVSFFLTLVSLIFVSLFFLQGLLSHPTGYLAPIKLFYVVILGAGFQGGIEFIYEKVVEWRKRRLYVNVYRD